MKNIASAALVFCCFAGAPQALAEGQGVVAVVNDRPVTSFDVAQRQKLIAIFGSEVTRKRALQSLIDDEIKLIEGKKAGLTVTDKMVDDSLVQQDGGKPGAFLAKFRKQGIGAVAVRRFIVSQILFNGIFRRLNPGKEIGPTKEMIDRKQGEILAEFNKVKQRYDAAANDPRRKPVNVYTIQQIGFPLDGGNDANAEPLLQARAVEVQQFLQRFKGCKSARSAADGIYNVKVGKQSDADASKLPRQFKQALDKVGPGRAVGPIRDQNGLLVIGFCGKRTITPPKLPPPPQAPSREQVANSLRGPALDQAENEFMTALRAKNSLIIDYKDQSLSQ